MEKAIKVLHLSAGDSGGAYIFAENLSRFLLKQDIISRHLVFSGQKSNIRLSKISRLDKWMKTALHAMEKLIQYFYEKDSSVRFTFSLGFTGITSKKLRRICLDADIIHLHWINKGFIRLETLESLGKPIVWTCHDLWPVSGGCHLSYGCTHYHQSCGNCPFLKLPEPDDLSHKIHQRKQALYPGLKLAFASPSHWMDRNVAASSLSEDKEHLCIQNGIDTSAFYCKSDRENIGFTIGFVAANLNDKNKALFRLTEAIQRMPDPSVVRLILVGQAKEAIERSKGYTIEIYSTVHEKERLADLYNRMDVLVCTSSIETFPTTLMEAYCCGSRGLGFNVGGIPEIVESMGDVCVDAFDIQALADRLHMLSLEKHDRKALSEKAGKLFDIQKTAALYADLYRRMHG